MRWMLGILLAAMLAGQAGAGIKDDHYEGNIFVIYGGNGAIIPPRTTLAESRRRGEPVMLVFYVNDSKDCKAYTLAVTRLQVGFERAVNFVALHADSLGDVQDAEAAKYFKGVLPYTVLFDGKGRVVYEKAGVSPYQELLPHFQKMVINP